MARSVTVMFQVPAPSRSTAEEQLGAIAARLEELIVDRMCALEQESLAVSSDLEALHLRLRKHGHQTDIEDIKTARWWKTKHELVIARLMYGFVCQVSGSPERTLSMVSVDEDCVPESAEDFDG